MGIVGAGLTGLAAAVTLKRAGAAVTVYEAADRAGGMVRTERVDGFTVEMGPAAMAAPAGAVAELIDRAGLTGRLVRPVGPMARFVARRGRPLAVPASLGGFLRTPLLSVWSKFRVVREPFVRPGDNPDDETVAAFMRRRFGGEIVETLVDPVVAGTCGGTAETIAVRHAYPALVELERAHGSLLRGFMALRGGPLRRGIVSFDGGLGVLPDALAAGLGADVRLHAPVEAVERGRDGWRPIEEGQRGGATHDAVIIAGPAHGFRRMGLPLEHATLSTIAAVPHPPLAVVALGYRRTDVRHPLDGFGCLVPARERLGVLGIVFSSSVFAGRVPADAVLVNVFIGGAREPELALQGEEEIAARAMSAVDTLLGVRGDPILVRVRRHAESIPQYVRGHGAVLEAAAQVERRLPGVVLAGSWRDGVAVGDALRSGVEAAARTLAHIRLPVGASL